MQGIRINIVRQEAQSEGSTYFQLTGDVEGGFVQVGQSFHQSQPDARAGSLIWAVGLVVSFKNVRQGFRSYSMPGIADADFRILHTIFLHTVQGESDAAFRGILGCIGQEIVQDGVQHVRIVEELGFFRIDADMEVDFGIPVQFLVAQPYFLYQFGNVTPRHG